MCLGSRECEEGREREREGECERQKVVIVNVMHVLHAAPSASSRLSHLSLPEFPLRERERERRKEGDRDATCRSFSRCYSCDIPLLLLCVCMSHKREKGSAADAVTARLEAERVCEKRERESLVAGISVHVSRETQIDQLTV